ncbi:hypothetical protein TWF191_005718 [Orbilia oligospora]|uniref:Transcription elongation factor 1 homolog n=1 Tax=Orbilia oligospora TaxID=2813651 RepID=A0A7C8R3P6_ORBOL|nr:hypothetical protein TWF191_005718 [Orbilia oligospora]
MVKVKVDGRKKGEFKCEVKLRRDGATDERDRRDRPTEKREREHNKNKPASSLSVTALLLLLGKRRKAIKVKGELKESVRLSIIIKLDKKNSVGSLHCNVCGQTYQTSINYLSGAVDVYADWVDAADEVKKEQRRAAKRGGNSSGGGESRGDLLPFGPDENGSFVNPPRDAASPPAPTTPIRLPRSRASTAAVAAAEGSASPPIRTRPRPQAIDLDSDPGGNSPLRPPSDISSISDHGPSSAGHHPKP